MPLSQTWHLALLSDTHPGLEGPDLPALKDFRALHPAVPVIIIASQPDLQAAVAAIKAGASSYLAHE